MFLGVWVSVAFAALVAQQNSNAACMVTTSGVVNCNADTMTTNTTNVDGSNPASSDRIQLFDNGAGIKSSIQSGVSLSGAGLELVEGAATPLPIVMRNQGQLTTDKAVNALRIEGNGGPILYFGDGSMINTANRGAALFVDNVGGNVSIATGAGAISGTTGINASATGAGAVTIRTGTGLVTGTAGPAISASSANGSLNVVIGSGGATNFGASPTVRLISNNGDLSITANGKVSGSSIGCGSLGECNSDSIEATSKGLGSIVVGGSATLFGEEGRGIHALETITGLGGILVTGTGDTISGTTRLGCCSAVRAEILNPANSSDIIINRSGNYLTISTRVPPVMSDIHAITAGTGNIIVSTGAGATLTNTGLFGIDAEAVGKASTGSINVSTGAYSTLNTGGVGIFATNSASAIHASAASKIAVTNNGTINSGVAPNPLAPSFLREGGPAPTAMPAGILAGYTGEPVFGRASGPFTSCDSFGCTTLAPNPNVNGTVRIMNNGSINAAGGNGIFAFNFGNGDVSVRSTAPITVTGTTAQNGIEAFSAERGNISVTITANVTGGNGSGIQTTSAGEGTTTIKVLGGTTDGATSGVSAASNSGLIQITNSGTIQNISGLAGDLAVATSGSGDAILINNARRSGDRHCFYDRQASNRFINSGIWNTLGTSTFAGASSINNRGTINMFGPTTFSGLSTLTNGGTLNLAAGATVGTLTMPGNLVFLSSALYVAPLNVTLLGWPISAARLRLLARRRVLSCRCLFPRRDHDPACGRRPRWHHLQRLHHPSRLYREPHLYAD